MIVDNFASQTVTINFSIKKYVCFIIRCRLFWEETQAIKMQIYWNLVYFYDGSRFYFFLHFFFVSFFSLFLFYFCFHYLTLSMRRDLFVFANSIYEFLAHVPSECQLENNKYVCLLAFFSLCVLFLSSFGGRISSSTSAYEFLYLQFTSTYTIQYTLLTLCELRTFVLVKWHSASLCISIELVKTHHTSFQFQRNLYSNCRIFCSKYFEWFFFFCVWNQNKKSCFYNA